MSIIRKAEKRQTLPCVSTFEWIETNALIAGYVIEPSDAKKPAAHIILKNWMNWRFNRWKPYKCTKFLPHLTAETIPQHLQHFKYQT